MRERVTKVLAANSTLEESVLYSRGENLLIEDAGLDSLDTVNFYQDIEKEFNVTVSDVEALRVHTIADLVKLVEGKCTQSK